jgi:PKD repeat protein
MSRNPNVAYIEPDTEVWASAPQADPTWGLDRIDQRNLPLDNSYTYTYLGSGVTAYIIDTGIRTSHGEFGGRASYGWDFVDDDGLADDCNGHGTHVAGTVGGNTYGVAKGVGLVAVRVLNCSGSGTTSGVIAGIDWVTSHHIGPSVANMSLGGSVSASLDTAVKNSVAAGISYAVSAGNNGRNACSYSPARVPEAMTIGATDSTDTKASWSNYGDCVDWFAPGVSITSAWRTNDSATNTISGTSMASPHAAGVAALYLQAHPDASPAAVRDALYAATTKGIVASSSSANNHLLSSLFGPNQPPDASFTYSNNGLTVVFTDTSTDSDGSTTAWSWSFGDGGTSTGKSPTHAYAASGTYTVSLTVTDDAGGTDTATQSVTVTASTGIALTATGYKAKGLQKVDLAWSGATGTNVDIFRNGGKIVTTSNDGAYTDAINKKGGGTYVYQVCEAGSSTCSNTVTAIF